MTAVGLKVTLTVHLALGARDEPQLLVWEKGAGAWMLEMLSVPLRVLVKGVDEPMTSRAQDLARRYSTLDPSQPPAYRH